MKPFVTALLLLPANVCFSQQIVWEKRIGWRYRDELTDVVKVDDFSIMAAGPSGYWGYLDPRDNLRSRVTLFKFTTFGDSLWLKPLPLISRYPRLVRGDSGRIHVLCNSDTGNLAFNFLTVNYEGNVLSHQQFLQPQQFYVQRAIRARSGLIYACGFSGSETPGNLEDMTIVCIDPSIGLMLWRKRYTDHPYTRGGWIEETPRGTFLASGHAGSRIWAVEIDSAGGEIQRQTMFQTPSLRIFNEDAGVQQMPGGGYFVSVSAMSSPSPFYIGIHSGLSPSSHVWGGEQTGNCLPAHINQDSSVVLFSYVNSSRRLIKLRYDSSVVWEAPITSSLGSNSLSIYSFAYQADSSVVGVGAISIPGNQDQDFYLCRIKGVGVPYNPGEPVANKPRYKGLPQLIAYPTPTAGPLTVHTRSKLPLVVFSLSGKKLMQVPPDALGTTMLDISGLPSGLYLLRQGQAMVKVVRE